MPNAAGPPEWPHRLGKKPARPETIRFKLASYVDLSLPTPPAYFSHPDPPQFHDFDNSKYGCCVFAGAANETALWLHEARADCAFKTEDVLADYATVSGWDATKPWTDRGTDMAQAASYRRRIGILDASGKRQRIDAYCRVEVASMDNLRAAMWILGGVGLGFKFPTFAMELFKRGEPWDVQHWSLARMKKWLMGDDVAGGHYVPAIGIQPNGNIMCVTWGKVQEMTPRFYRKYADEVIAYLDLDRLDRAKRLSPEGFDERQLRRDLTAIAGGRPIYARPRRTMEC